MRSAAPGRQCSGAGSVTSDGKQKHPAPDVRRMDNAALATKRCIAGITDIFSKSRSKGGEGRGLEPGQKDVRNKEIKGPAF